MKPAAFVWERFFKMPIVGISRNITLEPLKQILPVYQEAGLSTVEVTMNTTGAEEIIRYARSTFGDSLNIGAGTVCSLEDLHKALDAGAQFIVTPVIEENVIRHCVEQGVPIFPGAFTPSEIFRAWTLGAEMIKVFPVTALGPGYLKDLGGPLNKIKLLPTGGISLANMKEYLAVGAAGLGIGGELFDKKLIAEKNWKGLLAHFKLFVKNIGA
jgi:2-dehydro-3-deoxyphosphogluconate aldolase/(4S)-4-hydroxy-2-oxoglutarate aldolase